jgi:hypothetical protein
MELIAPESMRPHVDRPSIPTDARHAAHKSHAAAPRRGRRAATCGLSRTPRHTCNEITSSRLNAPKRRRQPDGPRTPRRATTRIVVTALDLVDALEEPYGGVLDQVAGDDQRWTWFMPS